MKYKVSDEEYMKLKEKYRHVNIKNINKICKIFPTDDLKEILRYLDGKEERLKQEIRDDICNLRIR